MSRETMTDRRMIEELNHGREWLFSQKSSQRLLSTIRRELHSITRNMYIIRNIPEQYEELYDVLIDGNTVVHVEVPRDDRFGEIVFEKWTLDEYLRKESLGKLNRRKLQLAIELATRERRAP